MTPQGLTQGDANPQTGKGHGHTEVSNELLEAIYAYPWASTLALRIVLFVVRDSYGWKRKETHLLGFAEIAEAIQANRDAVFKAFRYLQREGAVVRGDTGGWGLVKNYRAWGNTPELPGIGVPSLRASLPTGNGCPQATETRCPQATKPLPTGNEMLPTGNAYRRKKSKERKKGGADAPDPKILPNGKDDTPRNRAALGFDELVPEDHPDFKRLSFKLQDQLTEQWTESRAREIAKNLCRKCKRTPKASETWAFCRSCTVCSNCSAKAGDGLKFTARGNEITCSECEKEKRRP